ncbi:MAG: TonB-dependent receptor, partial [Rhodothermales bacterium]
MRRLLILLLFASAPVLNAPAQTIKLDLRDALLGDALVMLSDQAGVDIVFAERLVGDIRISCRYEGRRADEALACLLAGVGLRAERVRRNQFVVVPVPPPSSATVRQRSSLSGFVADSRNGEVLPGAHVYLPELKKGAVANDAGYFALPSLPVGEYRVQVTYVGYAPREVILKNLGPAPTVALTPVTVEGGAILVEEDDDARSDLNTIPGLLSEPISRLEALPSFPGESDLFQALQWYPGIRKSGEVNGGLVIRGAPPDQNLYLLDGAPIYHPWHAFSLISTFQTETFKGMKLYRGSFPAEFGGRLASVLDAQMKDGSRSDPGALVALSALSGRFVIETPATRNSSFMLSGRRSYLDKVIGREHPVEDAEGRRDTLRTGYYFFDASAKYTLRMGSKDRLSLSYYHGGDDLDLRLPFDLSLDFSSWLKPADLFFEIGHRWQNRLLSGRYQHLYSEEVFVTATAYYSSYDAREAAFLRPTTSAVLNSDYRIDLKDAGVKVDFDYFHSLTHKLQVGVQGVVRYFASSLEATVRRSAGSIDRTDEESRTTSPELAMYIQDSWEPTAKWTLTPGLRVSFFGGGMYTDFIPGISVQYVVDPQYLILRAGADRNTQYLHQVRDRYAFTYDLVSSRWIPASSDVRPSTSTQVSGGFESRLAPGLILTGDAYW